MQLITGFFTVIVQFNVTPFAITVILLLPADLQVILPLLFTVATLLFDDVKVALPTSPTNKNRNFDTKRILIAVHFLRLKNGL